MGAPRIGLVDSGGPADAMQGACLFLPDGQAEARPDRLGHGTACAALIARAAPRARLLHAQVFHDRPVTSADRVARAILWLIPQADLIVMSLGLPADRAPLADACAQAQRAGVAMVASVPARGGPCWPAAYPGVIAASGDARCGWDDLSLLPGRRIGAWCASPEQGAAGMGAAGMGAADTGAAGMGGASLAAARVAGHLAAHWPEARRHPELWLAARAAHVGAERRGVPA